MQSAPKREESLADDLLDLFLSSTEDYPIILLDQRGRCGDGTEGPNGCSGTPR